MWKIDNEMELVHFRENSIKNQIVNCLDSHPSRAGKNSKTIYSNHFQKYLLRKTYLQYYLSLNSVNYLGLSNAILAFLRWYFLVK